MKFEIMTYEGKTINYFDDFGEALEYVKENGKFYIWSREKKKTIYDPFSGEYAGWAQYIREISGLKRVQFCEKYNIPLRTMENWEAGVTNAPQYVLDLLERAVREDYKIPKD